MTFVAIGALRVKASFMLISAGMIGYSVYDMKRFELEEGRRDGSPTKKILWDWGTRGASVRDLYNKLALMNRGQVMKMLDPISEWF